MNILFISLLRIGDFLMHAKIAQSLKDKDQQISVHFLVNDLITEDLRNMFPFIKFHVFTRFKYEKMINSFETPLLYPFWSLKSFIQDINTVEFDAVYDLTLQNISSRFLSLVNSKNKKGVFSWKPFLSSNNESFKKTIFQIHDKNQMQHYLDSLKQLYNFELEPGYAEVKDSKLILFQITTSDAKKSLDLNKWVNIIQFLKNYNRSYQYKVLSSPHEFKSINKFFKKEDIISASFSEAFRVLEGTQLLVSLDTSIKHLAVWSKTPTLEISIGSSHPIKTSGYQQGNYVLSSDYHCRPCDHSSSCIYNRNHCQDSISEDLIVNFIKLWIQERSLVNFSFLTISKGNELSIKKGEPWITSRPKEIYL
ncbi:MAG: glycosyltransferase family 9 protein [Bdellovibrionales bacterium]|nr:glycosyltransferase family 9 protein [Bdellovibrionales bacterium]